METKLKATPGPWNCLRGSAGGREIITSENAPIDICVLSHKDKTPSEINSNALLLAAAPDLYAALQKAALVLSGEAMTKSELIKALELAQAALAKARGEQ